MDNKKEEKKEHLSVDNACLSEIGFTGGDEQGKRSTLLVHRFEWGKIRVVLEASLQQSSYYLWPATQVLSNYIIAAQEGQDALPTTYSNVESIVELGAGCALPSLTALQAWHPSLQCIVVTDQDSRVLERARNNHEATLNEIYEQDLSDDGLNRAINDVGSIPVLFEKLVWGDNEHTKKTRQQLQEHTTSENGTADVILGSDLISSKEAVEPLFRTATALMDKTRGRFLLSQSLSYDHETEEKIQEMCTTLRVSRRTVQESEGRQRIEEFRFA